MPNEVILTIDGRAVTVPAGTTILEAARSLDIYIPTLCDHPDLPPARGTRAAGAVYQGGKKIDNAMPGELGKGCGLCVVEVAGEPDLLESCSTEVQPGMVVVTDNDRIKEKRQENLVFILARHPHACLTCAQQEGCSLTHCSSNVPENERCCALFGHCELQDVVNHVGISPATPRWVPTDLPLIDSDPLFIRDYNLCIGCTRCVRACMDLKGIEAIGFVYDAEGRVQVGTLAPTLEESGCKFCTACVEVCPTGALVDRAVRAGKKAQDLVPCKEACPAHLDVPAYVRLIDAGKRDEANAVIREKVPFPGILGRTCPHPCEDVCRRGEVNEPVAVCALKRYAAEGDKGSWKTRQKVKPDTGKKVAVVGAGPAGLTAAFYLRKQGHGVTVFEARSKAGGMMRYGIPRYRLTHSLLDREIQDILDLGVEFQPNRKLGEDITLEQMRSDGYDAVFLGVGAPLSRRIPLEGSDLPDVLWGVDFLGRVAEGEKIRLKHRVVVIGGGNGAVDAARTALRCGAHRVAMACLEKREDMPAYESEVESALAEGVELMTSWGPHKVLSDRGRIQGVALARCVSVFDDEGVFNPRFDDAKKRVEADQVILAMGQASDVSFLGEDSGITTRAGLIVVREDTFETGLKGVYAGGDVAAAEGSIIHAVAAGRKAASAMDKALGGSGGIDEVLFERHAPSQFLGRDEGFATWPREEVPELEVEKRREGFEEVALGYTDEQAAKEARRCLQCDLRLYMGANPSPPQRVLPFNQETINGVPEEEGVFRLYDGERNVLAIKGTANLRRELLSALEDDEKGAWFEFELCQMYSQRESEWIQKHVREHGHMPGAADLDDDLF
jgi:NADPH-dependent glutamate synthase beta subunit-like oxidoreductase